MNLAAAIAVASASVALAVAAYSVRLSRTPGWTVYRWLAVIATGSAAYALGNVATTTGQPDAVVLTASRFQLAGILLELWGWFGFSDFDTGRRPSGWERAFRRALLGFAALALVPGLAYGGAVTSHAFPPWGATYRDAVPTPFGYLVIAVGLAGGAWVVARLFWAWRCRVPGALVHALAIATLFAFAVNDGLAATGLAATPYLLDIGFLVPLGALFWSQGERVIQEATALRELRDRLEHRVAERTDELAAVHRTLHQAERLAAMGRFAAGVAHRFNNPAAVVSSTLNACLESATSGRSDGAQIEALLDAREAMQRITFLVRQLSEAGRVAAETAPAGGTPVSEVVERVLGEARTRHPAGVSFFARVPSDLRAAVGNDELGRAIGALVSNAAQAARRGRALHVVVTGGVEEGAGALIEVHDDGCGMDAETRERAFEPFFSTRADGIGAGLGLPVAEALIDLAGGSLTLESSPGAGTVARIRLPLATP